MNQPGDQGMGQARPIGDAPPAGYPATGAPPAGGTAYGTPGTGVLAADTYYDQASGLTLPQGVELASTGRRIGAYFLAFPLAVVTLFIGYAIWGLIIWGSGQTPALQVLGMRCWRPQTGTVANWGTMALREIIGRLIESIPIVGLVSFILMLTRPDRRCVHDLVAGTVVVHDPNKTLASKAV